MSGTLTPAIIAYIGAVLSSTASAAMISVITYVWSPDLGDARFHLILFLGMADFLNSTNNAIAITSFLTNGGLVSSVSCWISGFLGQYSIQASDLSTAAVVLLTYVAVSTKPKKKGEEAARIGASNQPKRVSLAVPALPVLSTEARDDVEGSRKTRGRRAGNRLASEAQTAGPENPFQRLMWTVKYFALMIWGTPLVTSVVGGFLIGYHPAGPWCWFPSSPRPLASTIRYSLTHGWRIACFLLIITLFPAIYREVTRGHFDRRTGRIIRRLIYYPVVYLIIWAPGMIWRFLEAIGMANERSLSSMGVQVLVAMQSLSQFLGLADAVVFGFTEDIRLRAQVVHAGRERGRHRAERFLPHTAYKPLDSGRGSVPKCRQRPSISSRASSQPDQNGPTHLAIPTGWRRESEGASIESFDQHDPSSWCAASSESRTQNAMSTEVPVPMYMGPGKLAILGDIGHVP